MIYLTVLYYLECFIYCLHPIYLIDVYAHVQTNLFILCVAIRDCDTD